MRYLLTTAIMFLIIGCVETQTPQRVTYTKPTRNNTAVQKEALVVGVSNYKGVKDDLDGVKKDVVNMTKLFREWGFNVTTITDEESMRLEQYLQRFSSNLDSNDKFIFYYSGHGSHTKDESGDEDDGEDEALVLSDGMKNKLFIDDALFGYLNSIKAQKMVMLDSCHSGTAFKAFGDQPKPKSLINDVKHLIKVIKTKIFDKEQSDINSGEFVVFSASQDNEQSLDTKRGGMFTKAFYKQFQGKDGKNIRMMNLRGAIATEIKARCAESNSKTHHPNISASSNKLKYKTLGEFLGL